MNISVTKGANGTATINNGVNPAFTIMGGVTIKEIAGGVEIYANQFNGLDIAERTTRILTSDNITVNGSAYVPANAASLHTKLRDEVFFLTNAGLNRNLVLFETLGATFLGETMPIFTGVSSNALASGTARFDLLPIEKTGNITGLMVNIAVSGVYTPSNFNGVALFSVNPATGAINQVAISANIGALWSGAAGYVSVPLTASYPVKAGELYVTMLLYNSSAQTTAPSVRGANIAAAAVASYPFPNNFKLSGAITGQNTAPASANFSSMVAGSTAMRVQAY